jgi:single-strand DNA-binding protein
MQLLGGREGMGVGSADEAGDRPARGASAPRAPAPKPPAKSSSTGFDDMDDDIPF